jgi:hypothetical protein
MPTINWKGPTNALVIQPNSPKLVYSDRVKATTIMKGVQALCAASMLPRGTFGTGIYAGWVINQSTVDTERGAIGTLTYDWEAGGAGATQPLPVGDFDLEPQELYPKIERAGVFKGITFKTLNICYNALYLATNATGTPLINDNFLTTNITDPTQLALAANLVSKLLKGEETFYMAGWRYWFEIFSYTEPFTSRGGVTGTPSGPLARLPANVAWLRLADKLEPAGVNGSMYKLTVTWLGGPVLNGVGYWDSDVYS